MMKKESGNHQTLELLGERIRKMRKEKDITLGELANASEITVAYLSQIERNLVEPSLPVLRRIAKSLKTEVSMFFVDEVQTDVLITRAEEEKLTDILKIHYRFMMPSRLADGMKTDMSVMIAYIEPDSKKGAESLVHEGAEFTTVLSGELHYLIDGEIYHLFEGDSIYIDRNVPHIVYNPTSIVTKCLAVIEIV